MEPLLRASGLGRRYGRSWVLHDVTLSLTPGEAVAVVGANGAGKSTLLSILATLNRPNTGHLELFGIDVLKHPRKARAQMGYLGHQTLLNDALTAHENLRFYADLFGVEDPETTIANRLAAANLTPRADDRVDGYSRGMKQRLSLARALLHDPTLLLLDEPFSGLDAPGARDLANLLAHQRQHGRAMVVVSHQLRRVHDWCDRVVVLHRGQLVEDAPSRQRSAEEWIAHLAAVAEDAA